MKCLLLLPQGGEFWKGKPRSNSFSFSLGFLDDGSGLQAGCVVKTWESSARSSFTVEEKRVCGTWGSWRGWSGSATELCLEELGCSLNEACVSGCLSNPLSAAGVGPDRLVALDQHHPAAACATCAAVRERFWGCLEAACGSKATVSPPLEKKRLLIVSAVIMRSCRTSLSSTVFERVC